MFKKLLISILSASLIIAMAAGIIFYSRGYRYDPAKQKVSSTGILSVSSYPEKASIFVDGKLTSATNASITLPPGWYQVKISKDGYQSWEKKMKIQGEVVSQIDALLVPNNPSLKTLTATGIMLPTLSPSGTRVAYLVNNTLADRGYLKSKNGLYVLELRSGTLGSQPEPKLIFAADRNYNYDQAKIYWSYDEKEIILAFVDPKSKSKVPSEAYLFSLERPDQPLDNIAATIKDVLTSWSNEQALKEDLKLKSLSEKLYDFLASNSADIRFSPDETKILYKATASATLQALINPPIIGTDPTDEERTIKTGNYYVYDLKEDKNFPLGSFTKPEFWPFWYTDSKHLVAIEDGHINIVDYDGTNKRSIYSGPFQDNLVFPWGSGGKIVILTNFNRPGSLADLYEVDLR